MGIYKRVFLSLSIIGIILSLCFIFGTPMVARATDAEMIDANSTKLGVEMIIENAADALILNQNKDGGWGIALQDGDPNSISLPGYTGAVALGLLRAKDALSEQKEEYLAAAKRQEIFYVMLILVI